MFTSLELTNGSYPSLVVNWIFYFVDNENLIFRGNTFATKAVDTYMKMVGEGVSKHERERERDHDSTSMYIQYLYDDTFTDYEFLSSIFEIH